MAGLPPRLSAYQCITGEVTVDDKPRGHEGALWNALSTDKQSHQKIVYQNPSYEEIWTPVQGPALSVDEQRVNGGIRKNTCFATSPIAR